MRKNKSEIMVLHRKFSFCTGKYGQKNQHFYIFYAMLPKNFWIKLKLTFKNYECENFKNINHCRCNLYEPQVWYKDFTNSTGAVLWFPFLDLALKTFKGLLISNFKRYLLLNFWPQLTQYHYKHYELDLQKIVKYTLDYSGNCFLVWKLHSLFLETYH